MSVILFQTVFLGINVFQKKFYICSSMFGGLAHRDHDSYRGSWIVEAREFDSLKIFWGISSVG
jgi:hypothetical protein